MFSVLLRICHGIDAVNSFIGKAVVWLILASVLISTGNALVRYMFDWGSNAFLEAQWYLYAAVYLLCASYVLYRDEHVRIDVVSSMWTRRTQVWVDVFGFAFFLLPVAILIGVLSWPFVASSFMQGEVSSNTGGLIRWPLKALVPLGFALLTLQGVSELIKRLAFLAGAGPDPAKRPIVSSDVDLSDAETGVHQKN